MFSFIMPKKVALSGVCLVLFYYITLAFFSKIRKLNVTKRSQKYLAVSVIFFVLFMAVSRQVRIKIRTMKNKKGSKCFVKQVFFASHIFIFTLVFIICHLFKRWKKSMKQRAIQREQVAKQTKIKCDKLYCLSHFITQMFAFIAINTFL